MSRKATRACGPAPSAIRPLATRFARPSNSAKDVEAAWDDGVLELTFELPAGSYATVLLEELFGEGLEEGADGGTFSGPGRSA